MMKRLLMPILIIPVFASVLLISCNSVPMSEPTSSEYQQKVEGLEQQIQLLTQQLDSLKENINLLECKLETLPVGTGSDFNTKIEQQMAQLREQMDELNVEVVAIKQQLAEKGTEKETTSYPSAPTTPLGTIFTFSGQGPSQSLTFTVHSSPWKLKLWVNMKPAGSAPVGIYVHDPTQPEGEGQVGGYDFHVFSGVSTLETISYIPAGTYYLYVSAPSYDTWTVWIVEL